MRRSTRSLAVALSLAVGSAPARAQDPFAPGVVWRHATTAAAPAIPTVARFAGGDALVLSASSGVAPSLSVFDEPGAGDVAPRAEDDVTPAGAFAVSAAAGRRGDALYALVQHPDPTAQERRTRVHRLDPVAASGGAPFAPVWTHDVGFRTNGPARIVCDRAGDVLVVAVWDGAAGHVQLDRLDGATGALLARTFVDGFGVQALALSADGQRAAVTSGLTCAVVDAAGALVVAPPLATSTPALALDASGRTLAFGELDTVHVLRERAGAWTVAARLDGAPTEAATRLSLAHDGATLAVGWWDHAAQDRARLAVADVRTGAPLLDRTFAGGTLQNLPEVVRLTPDGRRVALGLWGDDVGGAEAWLFEVASGATLLALDVPGSVRDLDLSADGTRLAVAYKDGHANHLGSTGGTLLAQTGERCIDQERAAQRGGDVSFHTRLAGATTTFLLVGEAADPAPVLGAQGWLRVDRATLAVLAAPTHAGRAEFLVPVPDDPAWVGRSFAAQPVFRVGGATVLGAERLDALVLE